MSDRKGACLVIGAGDDTGAAIARAFAKEGMIACLVQRPRHADDAPLNPDHIAANYVMLHKQMRTAWTHELDIRPWKEKW